VLWGGSLYYLTAEISSGKMEKAREEPRKRWARGGVTSGPRKKDNLERLLIISEEPSSLVRFRSYRNLGKTVGFLKIQRKQEREGTILMSIS